jgi:transposase
MSSLPDTTDGGGRSAREALKRTAETRLWKQKCSRISREAKRAVAALKSDDVVGVLLTECGHSWDSIGTTKAMLAFFETCIDTHHARLSDDVVGIMKSAIVALVGWEVRPTAVSYIPSSREFRLLVTPYQERVLSDWVAAYRMTWNACLEDIRTKKRDKKYIMGSAFRNEFVTKKGSKWLARKSVQWVLRTPKRVREYAQRDLVSSYKGAFTRLMKRKAHVAHVKKRSPMRAMSRPTMSVIGNKSSMDEQETITISHEQVLKVETIRSGPRTGHYIVMSDNVKLPRANGKTCHSKMRIKVCGEPPCKADLRNMKLVKRGSSFSIIFVRFEPPKVVKKDAVIVHETIAIDPGIKVYGTYFSPAGEWGVYGEGVRSWLSDRYVSLDALKGHLRRPLRARYRARLKRAVRKRKRRIRDKISAFQWDMAHQLLRMAKTILIPRLYVSKCGSGTLKRQQNDMKHCRFVDRLVYKSMQYATRRVFVVNESYTSKTCGYCGFIDDSLGAKGEYKCPKCETQIHRDLNGARNIFLKNFVSLSR